MSDLDQDPPRRRRRWPWVVLAVFGGAVLVVVGWWRAAGTNFLYRQIDPAGAELLGDGEIPAAPEAEALVADLRLLAAELPRRHADFADAFDPEAYRALLARLAAEAPRMTPEQRQMALLRVLAAGGPGTGHTMVVPLQRALDWRHYGLAFYDFADGLHVVAAAARHGPLAGARVLAVGGVEPAEALARLAPYVAADNEWTRRLRAPELLGLAEPLKAVGLADAEGRTVLTVETGEGRREIELEPFRLATLAGMGWGLRMDDGVSHAWSPADPRPHQPIFETVEPEDGVIVLRVHAVAGGLGAAAAHAVARARELAAAGELRRFVVDLRSNGGGNNQQAAAAVDAIAGDPVVDRRGVLYVLIGRRTFSAAGNLAAALERRTRATFAGEPTGSAPAQWGDNVPWLLPGTKVVAKVATRLWLDDLPGVRRTAIEPDLEVPLTSRDHFDDRDPALAAVLAHRTEERAPPGAPAELPAELEGTWLATPLHRVTIRAGRRTTDEGIEVGRLPRLEISTGEPFAETDLHPLGGGRWATDIRGVEIVAGEGGGVPVLRWKVRDFPLRRAPADHRLPLELLGDDDAEPPIEPDVDAAVAAFRAAAREVEIDSDFELAINSAGYDLLRDGRADEAVSLFRLNTELFPASANTWDSLGDGLREAGDTEAARAAYLHALDLDPTFEHSRDQLAELDREG